MQTPIKTLFMRGGTSRGPFFNAADLPDDLETRNRVLLAALGSPDKRQIDGLGGAHPLTSKVGIVSKSTEAGVDLDFLFAQIQPDQALVDTTPNCGNMLAAVVPFAIETGMISVQGDQTTCRVLSVNTGMQCDITVDTRGGYVHYTGDTTIDGVPGSAAPISINFLDTAGSICPSLLPTGKTIDQVEIEGLGTISVTCIDNGMPMVLMRAQDMGCTGYETVDELNKNTLLKQRVEALRLKISPQMGLGDVSKKSHPKMCLLSAPHTGGSINTRCFIPAVCHDAIGVLAAVTVATACVLENTVASGLAIVPDGALKTISVEHPSGEFSVALELAPDNPQQIIRSALLRTARLLMRGEVMIPSTVWAGETK